MPSETPHHGQDWDPRAPDVLADPITAYDRMRHQCPVAYSDYLHHSVFRHADVLRVVTDHQRFSSQASSHVSVPNSMDPPEHDAWRAVIDPYFSAARMAEFEPECRRICHGIVRALPRNGMIEAMFDLAHPFALRTQCAFMGWSEALHEPLLEWIYHKNAATLSGDRGQIAAVAIEFDDTIRGILQRRRALGDSAPDDVTGRLMRETIHGRPITEEEIVSILRNWTVGELGTMASSVGIIAHYLAAHPELQDHLRQNPALIRAANDEILRIHAPLIANRRTPTCPVQLGGKTIQPGERVTVIWASANRDEAVFGDPDEFRLDRDPTLNLLYGAGVHACPGAPLARLEIEIMVQALLAGTQALEQVPGHPALPAIYPASGYRQAPLRLRH
ncbi:cytochrome P450 [Castellaniella sp.]|uniref:cytochrome P450 n=1 Tax=Castellaniella sp. TaxID=1955812 RepID=UPI003569BDF7